MAEKQKILVREAATLPPQDVVDFFIRWSEFRPSMVELCKKRSINVAEREAVAWLVRLVDRISHRDLE